MTIQTLRSPAVQRGLLSLVAAVVVLAFPDILKKSVWVLATVGAIVFGFIEFLAWWREGRRDRQELARALVLILGGVAVIVFRQAAIRAAEVAFAGLLTVRGVLRLYGARQRWMVDREDPFWDILRAVVALLLAVTIFLFPQTLIEFVLILLALGWIVAGLVVLVHALRGDDPDAIAPSDFVGVLKAKTMPSEERRQITETIFEGTDSPGGTIRFVALMAFATAIAAFGAEADSTAVVIGAMLIAPLMSPIMALSASILMGWPR